MILSMTGFGHGECEEDNKRVTIDIKSVNGKFLDVNVKISRQFLALEDMLKKMLNKTLSRGTVDIFVNFFDKSDHGEEVIVDYSLAKKLKEKADELSILESVPSAMTAKDLLKFPDVLSVQQAEVDVDDVKPLFEKAMAAAIKQFDAMRKEEGKQLEKDLLSALFNVEKNMAKIEDKAPEVVKDYSTKLTQRIKESLAGTAIDEAKLLNEIAFFADKADINEEIVRMKSHIKQFKTFINSKEPSGKQFEFLAQEMTRETNTIGSKANSLELTNCVLYQKNELEKIKEQIRNVE